MVSDHMDVNASKGRSRWQCVSIEKARPQREEVDRHDGDFDGQFPIDRRLHGDEDRCPPRTMGVVGVVVA